MKILVTNLFLQARTGSEMYVINFCKMLSKNDIDFTLIVRDFGKLGQEFREQGYDVVQYGTNDYFNINPNDYDLVHYHHREMVELIYDKFKEIPSYFVSHGVLPESEKPLEFTKYKHCCYCGVSEETAFNAIKCAGLEEVNCYENEILRNIIDFDTFDCDSINNHPKRLLVISNYMQSVPDYMNIIKKSCEIKAIEFKAIGACVGNVVDDVFSEINNSDIIVGIGRCAMEGMAMGKNVIVMDYQGMDGMLDSPQFINQCSRFNFSGRLKNKKNITVEEFIGEISKYNTRNGSWCRDYIKQNHSYYSVMSVWRKMVDRILSKKINFYVEK